MQFDFVSSTVMGVENTDSQELTQGDIQGIIERNGRFLPEEFGKSAAMEVEDSGIDIPVDDMPADTQDGLIGNQTDGVWPVVSCGVIRRNVEHTGNDAPRVGIDWAKGVSGTKRMTFLMTGTTQTDTFQHVILVVHKDVLDGCFGFSIQLPDTQDDVVQLDDMMDFEVFDFLASFRSASRRFVSLDPFAVDQRGSDALVNGLPDDSLIGHG